MSHFGPPVAAATSNDPLFRMRAYQVAKDLLQAAWSDAKALSADPVTEKMSGQLYAAIGSISANIGEGYSRSLESIGRGSSSTPLVLSEKAWRGTRLRGLCWAKSCSLG